MKFALRAKTSDAVSTNAWQRATPLWKTVPKRDETGKPLSDFMMFAPGFSKKAPWEVQRDLTLIRGVLEKFDDVVVFADFNVPLSLLWVSLRCRPGAMSMLVVALRAHVPSLKLVGHNPLNVT